MSLADELEKLGRLRAEGFMSEEEFAQAKAKLLEKKTDAPAADPPPPPPDAPHTMAERASFDVNQWAMFLHLCQLANAVAAPLGFIGSIVMWQIKKDESPLIDRHGKMVTNWAISVFIYFIIGIVLALVFVGFLLLIALWAACAIFAIVGGVKANNGEFWEYPLTIKFLK